VLPQIPRSGRWRDASAGSSSPQHLSALPGTRQIRQLDNGLRVCVLTNRQAPLVATALCFRAGTRDEPKGQGGIAHFLEHMMFKGAALYGRGAIDRHTQRLGGANNAFTSHDLTVYYFHLAGDRWTAALDMEEDRLRGLTLDPEEVSSERQVIEEEIAMYESEPWDALEIEVSSRMFAPHSYGRPVLGTRAELAAIGGPELAAFQRAFYDPSNAVFVVAGDVGEEAFEAVAATLGQLPSGSAATRNVETLPVRTSSLDRLSHARGNVARLLLSLPAPGSGDSHYPAARLVATVLAGGRSSRLQRALVDEGQLATWVTAEIGDHVEMGDLTIAAEVVPGVEPEALEAGLMRELRRLVDEPPSSEEIERARQITLADWIFNHERIHEQAVAAAVGLALFGPDYLDEQLAAFRSLSGREIGEVAADILDLHQGGVLAWSLPREER
jgi:zinc protease